MKAAIIILFVYAIIITAKYLLKCGEIIEYDNKLYSLKGKLAVLDRRIEILSEDLKLAILQNKASSEIINRIKAVIEPSIFDCFDGDK